MHTVERTIDVGIQIVNYKSVTYLSTCLHALIRDLHNGPSHTIRVLENGSGDDLENLEKEFHSAVDFSYNQKNIGFGPAHNQLAADNMAHTLLLLNPDTQFIESNTVNRLLERLETDQEAAVVGPKLIDSTGTAQSWDHGDFLFDFQILGKKIRPYFFPLAPSFSSARTRNVPWVSGAVFLVDRLAFQAAGGFDPNLFLYFEEIELCHRLLKSGQEILYDPTIVVQHIGSVSTAPTKHENYIRSFGYVTTKEYPLAIASLMKSVYSRLPKSIFE